MELTFNIKNITIVHNGSDHIYFETDIPSFCWPYEKSSQGMSFKIEAGGGQGLEFLKKYFPDQDFSKVHQIGMKG